MKKFVSLLVLIVLFSSCNEYQKALKRTISAKFEIGTKCMRLRNILKLFVFFEQIATISRQTSGRETLHVSQSYLIQNNILYQDISLKVLFQAILKVRKYRKQLT
jgi:outer membrane protein assembly factor BamD